GGKYFLKGVYLPINPRTIEQSVRLYRSRLKDTGKWDLDWTATIKDVSKRGHFDQFILKESQVFSSDLTVLIDHSASMAAFDVYSEAIADAVARSNIHQAEKVFYFSNQPGAYLFTDRMQTERFPFERLVQGARRSILIISDAGAARGFYQRER